MRRYGSPAGAMEAGGRQWVAESLATERQIKSLRGEQAYRAAEQDAELIAKKGYNLLIWPDPGYPDLLRNIPTPPLFLYFKGNSDLLNKTRLAVVGSRKCSGYGLDMARNICSGLSENGVSIVSGFAAGIDREAHYAGLSGAGSSVAVLGTGIDLVYPAGNRDLWIKMVEKGLILSEFPPGTEPEARNFPHRNRIISGLSNGVLVVQGTLKSGSLITASLALDQGREVFAVPGAVNMPGYEGCNQLIRDGAYLVRSFEDVLEVMGCSLHDPGVSPENETDLFVPETELDEQESIIAHILARERDVHIDDLTRETGMDSSLVSRILTGLEIKGVVRRAPGMYYNLAV